MSWNIWMDVGTIEERSAFDEAMAERYGTCEHRFSDEDREVVCFGRAFQWVYDMLAEEGEKEPEQEAEDEYDVGFFEQYPKVSISVDVLKPFSEVCVWLADEIDIMSSHLDEDALYTWFYSKWNGETSKETFFVNGQDIVFTVDGMNIFDEGTGEEHMASGNAKLRADGLTIERIVHDEDAKVAYRTRIYEAFGKAGKFGWDLRNSCEDELDAITACMFLGRCYDACKKAGIKTLFLQCG